MLAVDSLKDVRPGEMPTVSRRCQRWNGRRLAWHLADPAERFDAGRYEVRELADDTTPKAYIVRHHYSGSFPNALRRFGLYHRLSGRLVGVAVFSLPVTGSVLTCVLPDLAPGVESMELGRLVLDEAEPGNTESWFVARCHEQLAAVGVRGVLSCADPVRRMLGDGTVTAPGHVGFLYQALNGVYAGRTTARTLWMLPDGTIVSDKAKQKIRDQDQGHDYAERLLIRWGARPMRAGENPKQWLKQAGHDAKVTLFRHHGCHRYVFTLGSRTERRNVHVRTTPLRYPKAADPDALVAADIWGPQFTALCAAATTI